MRVPALLLLEAQAEREEKGPSPSCLDENPSPDGASAGTAQNSGSLAKETSIVITKYLLKVTGLSHRLRLCVQSRATHPGLWHRERGETVPPQGFVLKMNRSKVQTWKHWGQGRESSRKWALEGEQEGLQGNKPSSVHSRSQMSLVVRQPLFPVSLKPHSGPHFPCWSPARLHT